jgi:hypothetical protein
MVVASGRHYGRRVRASGAVVRQVERNNNTREKALRMNNPAQQEHKGVLGQERKQKNNNNEEPKGILMKSTLNNGQDDECLGIARWTVGVVLFFIFYFPYFGFWIFGGPIT